MKLYVLSVVVTIAAGTLPAPLPEVEIPAPDECQAYILAVVDAEEASRWEKELARPGVPVLTHWGAGARERAEWDAVRIPGACLVGASGAKA